MQKPVAADAVGPRPTGISADAALLAVALAAGLGSGRLTTGPGEARVAVPIVCCAVVGHVTASVVGRHLARRRPGAEAAGLAALAGMAAVTLAGCWTILGSATLVGLPTATTWRSLWSAFAEAGSVITSVPTPVPATTGVVLCLALGAGLVAVVDRAIWTWQQTGRGARPHALVATVAAMGLFAYTALLSSGRDRVAATVTFLAATLWFAFAADHTPSGGRRRGRLATPPLGTAAASVVGSVVVVVTLVTAPALATMHVDAFLHTGGDTGNPTESSSAGALGLVDDLGAPTASGDTRLMFAARSPVPTYWQVATLSLFDGVEWLPGEVMTAPTLPTPTGATFAATVTIDAMRATLLPAPPATTQVLGHGGLRLVAGNAESVATSTSGTQYSVVARVPPGLETGRGSFATVYRGVAATRLATYLALPPMAPEIASLAHRIVAGSPGPLAEAYALVRWFDSGTFRYTTRLPVSGNPDPLTAFLFDTHAGFCQQFAGAFAVLARADGLPTRVAVGFTQGAEEHGVYRVFGVDAHAWPEVYLGPRVGWVSFEPTPDSPGPPPSVIQGSAPVPNFESSHQHTTGSTVAPTRSTLPDRSPTSAGKAASARRTGSSSTGNAVVLIGAVAVVGAVALGLVRAGDRIRRRWEGRCGRILRRRSRPGPEPWAQILESWRRAEATLGRASLRRLPCETPNEHAVRLDAVFGGRDRISPPSPDPDMVAGSAVDVDYYRALAGLATKAVYGRAGCSPTEAARARELEVAVRAKLDVPARDRASTTTADTL